MNRPSASPASLFFLRGDILWKLDDRGWSTQVFFRGVTALSIDQIHHA